MPPKAEKADKTVVAEKPAPEAARLTPARERDLEAAIASITKTYGDGSIMRLGSAVALKQIEVIPTGALAMDLALGVGGLPRGRVIEIYGPESSGKTTIMLHVIANAQKKGGLAALKKNCRLTPVNADSIYVACGICFAAATSRPRTFEIQSAVPARISVNWVEASMMTR